LLKIIKFTGIQDNGTIYVVNNLILQPIPGLKRHSHAEKAGYGMVSENKIRK
jgi:hypothetical protein